VIWTAWKNGKHNRTGTGYGFELSPEDRDEHFSREWQAVILDLPHGDGFMTARQAQPARHSGKGVVNYAVKKYVTGFIMNIMLPGQIAYHQSSRSCHSGRDASGSSGRFEALA
jgi:hypothetical protein